MDFNFDLKCPVHNKPYTFYCKEPFCGQKYMCPQCISFNKQHETYHLKHFVKIDEFLSTIMLQHKCGYDYLKHRVGETPGEILSMLDDQQTQIKLINSHISQQKKQVDSIISKIINSFSQQCRVLKDQMFELLDQVNSSLVSTLLNYNNDTVKVNESLGSSHTEVFNKLKLNLMSFGNQRHVENYLKTYFEWFENKEHLKFIDRFSQEFKTARTDCFKSLDKQRLNLPVFAVESAVKKANLLSEQYFSDLKKTLTGTLSNYPLQKISEHTYFSLAEKIQDVFHKKNIKSVITQMNNRIVLDVSKTKVVKSQKAHGAQINSLTIVKEGTLIATAGSDLTIKLWTIPNLENIKTFKTLKIVKVLISEPTGRYLFSADDDQSIKIWESDEGNLLSNIEKAHLADILSLIFVENKRLIISGSFDKSIKVWDVSNPRETVLKQTMEGHTKPVNSLLYLRDGRRIASASTDGFVKIWDLNEGVCVRSLSEDRILTPVLSLAFYDQNLFLAGNANGAIRVWNTKTLRCVKVLKTKLDLKAKEQANSMEWVRSISYVRHGKYCLAGMHYGSYYTVRIWDVIGGVLLKEIKNDSVKKSKDAFYEEYSKSMLTYGFDENLKIWNLGAKE